MIRRQRVAVEAGKSLTNESSEDDIDEEGDSLLDEEMEYSSADEDTGSAEEEEDSGLANISDDAQSCESESETISPDFENTVSGKWIIAFFSIGRARKPYVAKCRMLRDANVRCQWTLPLWPDVRGLKSPSMTGQRGSKM
ncbi:hypothetical protein OUZ56_003145 [Daphnia magna]|uniref:Uncharacterized protein n=1 Tax=Daphnia magna TaxID=35525 RepID=A0ABR0A7X8_9CRUS|nr:hypothetical protein OUZ56_003145 [Daphnia magna]